MTVIGLRPATPADSEFCFRLHKAALGEYVAAIWGWDERDQRGHHALTFWRSTTGLTPSTGGSV
ncbi:hypothetical protein [Microbispora sp. CA-102843]|uniref:hypothetical protein n=1 Tax=Microbispora sp. CA-102843 TaxID=3239952 RepID=UPI003D8F9604